MIMRIADFNNLEEVTNMSQCDGCDKTGCESCSSDPKSMKASLNEHSNVKKVIAVMSGKGGVGKSMTTALLASAMNRAGYNTAVLDGDITGPSIPKLFGEDGAALSDGKNIFPAELPGGMKIMSINLMLEDVNSPVVWRGPILANVVKQFWSDTVWGDVDYMFVDMPPGTGDVPLTVFQSLPVDGIIVVTTPQELVSMIVNKAVAMAKMMNVPIIGLVENMSYIECPDCGKRIELFGKSSIEKVAGAHSLPVLARMPIRPEFASLADCGRVEEIECRELALAIESIKNL